MRHETSLPMTPPHLGLSRGRDRSPLDPALDDAPLAAARDALARGRWTEVRSLLADTGEDWDRRGHRLVVLAEQPASATWAQEWRLTEPDSADAVTLQAIATVLRAVRRKASPDAARELCLAAAGMAPRDPSPWLGALILARHTGNDDERARAFDQVLARHRDHHHAHHLMVACLAEHQRGHLDDPLHEVYDFASWAAEQAPADSPLAVLPVVAHAERYRVLAASGIDPGDPGSCGHWTTRRARQVMKTAFDWWLEWDGSWEPEEPGEPLPAGDPARHPRRMVDLNYLAHAKFHEGRMPEAAAIFARIGRHVTALPWSYPGRDAKKEFLAARDTALGSS